MRKLESPEKGTIFEEAGISFDDEEEKPLVHPLYISGKVPFSPLHLFNYFAVQSELWANTVRRLRE